MKLMENRGRVKRSLLLRLKVAEETRLKLIKSEGRSG
jgi:hypothetical protein